MIAPITCKSHSYVSKSTTCHACFPSRKQLFQIICFSKNNDWIVLFCSSYITIMASEATEYITWLKWFLAVYLLRYRYSVKHRLCYSKDNHKDVERQYILLFCVNVYPFKQYQVQASLYIVYKLLLFSGIVEEIK